jgi:hypothetical protein
MYIIRFTGLFEKQETRSISILMDPGRIPDTDPDPGQSNQCGSGSTTLRKVDIYKPRAFTGLEPTLEIHN